ncbi:hypothetical protein CEH05_18115 [Halobacillus halophilus]|uniref:Uncharacterized protein n=1 Tax=Halobacillus halophilus (strain ATCC 35676 / DSM 2266 / JCM 20832 / KCTC 3685 / LMG 17431 / NBRC 102448 / NCIMB 2269) TaxID=866895 RepID=I0JSA9_HALH3|nr:hypothetical protein [Halobacillus halophilus]ASF40967.1 hypothetical protein CEH05_18115 [Halobacillus halophilus]CCG47031.1 conserved hypothetical protein [Halobacillus halophilus DSM 2266]
MIKTVIDPLILALPNSSDSLEEFEEYVYRLLDVVEASEQNLKLITSKETSSLLAFELEYPEWDPVKKLLNHFGLTGMIQPKDIVGSIEKILKSNTIENLLQIEDILYENVIFSPVEISNNRKTPYLEELEKIALCILLAQEEGNNFIFVTKKLSQKTITVQGKIHEIESSDHSISKHEILTYKGDFLALSDVNRIYQDIDPITIWKNARSKEEYEYAVKIYTCQYTCTHNNSFKEWNLGNEFHINMRKYNFTHQESKINSLLRSIADAILDQNLHKVHSLRESRSGNSSQKTYKNKKALRRDIDQEFHLHYWVEGNHLEFAQLGVHNDMNIPSPSY